MMAWLIVIDQWLETATDILCAAFWAIVGAMAVVWLARFFLPTHVLIRSSERESTALCEQITTVSVDRLLGYKGHLTPAEMTNVEVAMLISLELEVGKPVEKIVEVTKEVPVIRDVKVSTPASNPNMAAELAAAKAKCEMLQIMYESLLNRVLAGKAG